MNIWTYMYVIVLSLQIIYISIIFFFTNHEMTKNSTTGI